MIYFFLFSFFVIMISGYYFFMKCEKDNSIFFIFSLFTFIYYLGIPVELILFNTSFVNKEMFLPQNYIEIITIMGVLSIIGFGLGYYLSDYKIVIDKDGKSKTIVKSQSLYFIAVFFAILIITFFSEELRDSFLSYKGNYTATYNNSFYAYSKEILFYSLSVLIAILSFKNLAGKIFAIVLSLFLMGFGIFSGDKDPMLLAVIAWGLFFIRKMSEYNLNKVKIYILLFFISVIIIPFSSNYFSFYRGGNKLGVEIIKEKGLYRLFESVGPMNSLVTVLEEEELEYKWGGTYVSGFINWIPRFIWNERPVDLSEKFAREKMKNWEPGKGYGFSLLTEAYINFGVFGAFIQYFIIGLMIGAFGHFTRWVFKRKQTIFADSIFFIWLGYSLVIMHRGTFNLPSAYIRFILPFALFYFSIDNNNWIIFLWRKVRMRFE